MLGVETLLNIRTALLYTHILLLILVMAILSGAATVLNPFIS